MDERWRRLAVSYLAVQTLAVLGWWTYLTVDPGAIRFFVGPRLPKEALTAYLLPDLATYGAGGATVAYLLHRQHPWAWPGLVFLAGGIFYATLATFALSMKSQGGWLGVPLMTASCGTTMFLAWRLRPR